MARQVNGQEVIADEPTPAPISHDGRPVVWQQTRTLLLADGSTVYGCAHCTYTSPNVRSIRPHLSKHKRTRATTSSDPVAALVKQLGQVEEITKDRDRWKIRALKAEKSLKTLRDALGVSS
ncbi:hypothetical protein [Labedaea rhizosphaerae]|uniref:Zinc finger protein 462-like seventh C2H2 zinc finger domain-containing protein n=1 Tax=Labedaea rhizosphaerae TaxID=598644 RepID=A0A4R6SI25_LABRH|nr:hypothetical protein [Labedaea rhizosphaerae]TDQ01287.1 hypothetical protein EV186_1021155 [Labedaea rhizosphaerae]